MLTTPTPTDLSKKIGSTTKSGEKGSNDGSSNKD
jgi:hypothetical protein